MIRITAFLALTIIACTPEKKDSSIKDWTDQEASLSFEAKTKLLRSLNDSIVNGMVGVNPDTAMLDLFHILDLNGDQQNDVLFNGFGGAADEFVFIYLKDSMGWKKAFQDYGHVQNVRLGENTELKILKLEGIGEEGGDSVLYFEVRNFEVIKVRPTGNL